MGTNRVPFGDWLQAELDKRGWSPSDLARAIGVQPATVSRWRLGQRQIRTDQAQKVAEALHIDPMVVLYHAGHIERLPRRERDYERDRTLARITEQLASLQHEEVQAETGIAIRDYGPVPANSLRWVAGESEEKMRRVPSEWIGTRSPESLLVVTASGNCLAERGIVDGSVVLIERNLDRTPRNGEIVLIRVGDEFSLKVWHREGDWIELRTARGEAMARLSIMAEFTVIGFYRASWFVADDNGGR